MKQASNCHSAAAADSFDSAAAADSFDFAAAACFAGCFQIAIREC